MQKLSAQQTETILDLALNTTAELHPEGCFELYLTKDYSQDIWSLCMFVPFPQLLWLP